MNRFRKLAVVTALGGSLLTASATPATAIQAVSCYPGMGETHYPEAAVDCVCHVIEGVGRVVDGEGWGCA